MLSLLLASTNRGKLVEIQAILAEMGMEHHFRLILPADIGLDLDVVEDGKTYAENAARKALAYSQVSGLCSLADDSGLEVSALGGEPGLFSARYSGISGATDADRRKLPPSKIERQRKNPGRRPFIVPWLWQIHREPCGFPKVLAPVKLLIKNEVKTDSGTTLFSICQILGKQWPKFPPN